MSSIDDLLKNKTTKETETQTELKEKLTEIKLKKEEGKVVAKAKQSGIAYINLDGFPISPDAIRVISQEQSVQYKAICFYKTDQAARIGVVNPDDENFQEFIKLIKEDHDFEINLYLISGNSFNIALERYKTLPKISKIETGVNISAEEFEKLKNKIKTFKDLNKEVQKTSISNLVTLIMASSVQSRTSDIHIEAEEEEIKIRFRIDGVLVDAASIDKKFWKRVISRIKLLSGLKINISNRPQDGRFRIDLKEDRIDVRVSSMPTAYGESVVMRLLRASSTSLTFEDLGFRKGAFKILEREVLRPNGMVLTTGPTGSGKTTSLYAILNKLNDKETKIITLEDPVEYHLKGVNQSQVDSAKGYTFAKGLRSILRQDPDVVMVGEIRDLETAEIAMQAALTGHVVISTLHTNDAAGALPRFLGMGVKPFLLAPAINAIIGQRLGRRNCKKCKQAEKIDTATMEKVKKLLSEIPVNSGETKVDLSNLKFLKGAGCDECQGIGYKGRVGIYEVFAMDGDIEKAILDGKMSEYRMKELAVKQGMVTMVQDGLLKALEGVTSVEEVFRVIE